MVKIIIERGVKTMNPYATQAISYIREKLGDEKAKILLVAEAEVELPLTNKQFWTAKLIGEDSNECPDVYQVYISKSESYEIFDRIDHFFDEEDALRLKTYGKLDENLFKKLDELNDVDRIDVGIWMNYQREPDFMDEVKEHFAGVSFDGDHPIAPDSLQSAKKTKHFSFDGKCSITEDSLLTDEEIKVRTDYISLVDTVQSYMNEKLAKSVANYKSSFVEELNSKNIPIIYSSQYAPSIYVSVTKDELMALQNSQIIASINEMGINAPSTSIGIATTRVYDLWNNGYNGGDRNIVNTANSKVVEILVAGLQVFDRPGLNNGTPGAGAVITGGVNQFAFHPIVRWQDGWCEIKIFRNINGWIFMNNNINAIGRFPGTGQTALVSGNNRNIYSSPATTSVINETVNNNTELIVLEIVGNWTRVVNPTGRTGWIANSERTLRTTGYTPLATNRVAVLEAFGIDFNNQYLINANGGSFRTPGYDPNQLAPHPTWVAGCVSAVERGAKGHAPGAILLNANAASWTDADLEAACDWAVTSNANVVNGSYGATTGNGTTGGVMNAHTNYMDFIARSTNTTIVLAAGNFRTVGTVLHREIHTPAIGYNVLAVGNIDQNRTGDWADDTLNPTSSLINPISARNDRHKPELSAPGTNIFTTAPINYRNTNRTGTFTGTINNGPGITAFDDGAPNRIDYDVTGTSFSAPMVAGIAAIAQEMDAAAWRRQVIIRAVLIAAATHRVVNPPAGSSWAAGEGTGTINCMDVRRILNTNVSSAGYTDWNATSTTFPNTSYTATLTNGQRLRVALVWNSQAFNNPPNPITNQQLIDLDLALLNSGGTVLRSSTSWDNTVEVVDYTATSNITVTIRVTAPTWNYAGSERVAMALNIY